MRGSAGRIMIAWLTTAHAADLGVTTLLLRVQWPSMPRDLVLEQIRLIGESVIPRLTA